MNQHFKKHLEASYTRAFEECARTGHKVGDLDAIFNSIAMATFAELIVKECMNICAEREEDIRNRIKDEGKAATAYMCRAYIKEHFGVEE